MPEHKVDAPAAATGWPASFADLEPKPPPFRPCPRSVNRAWVGVGGKDVGKAGCDRCRCWTMHCPACLPAKVFRYKSKAVPRVLASPHRLHVWDGRPWEWAAVRARFKRTGQPFDYCVVRLPGGRAFAVISSPGGASGVEPVSAREAAVRLTAALDRVGPLGAGRAKPVTFSKGWRDEKAEKERTRGLLGDVPAGKTVEELAAEAREAGCPRVEVDTETDAGRGGGRSGR